MPRPLVIAHRAAPLDADPPAVENSISGMLTALTLGADAIEVDVRRCLNGTPVLMHDRTAIRTGGYPMPVRMMSEHQLSLTRLRNAKEPIPTLAALLALVPDHVQVAADVKDPRAMRATIEVARSMGKLADLMLWCRTPKAVRLAGEFVPHTQLGYLHDSGTFQQTVAYLDDAAAMGAGIVSIHQRATTRESVAAAHERGLTAYAWALTADAHQGLLDAGVDGIVTDYPGILRGQVDARD